MHIEIRYGKLKVGDNGGRSRVFTIKGNMTTNFETSHYVVHTSK